MSESWQRRSRPGVRGFGQPATSVRFARAGKKLEKEVYSTAAIVSAGILSETHGGEVDINKEPSGL